MSESEFAFVVTVDALSSWTNAIFAEMRVQTMCRFFALHSVESVCVVQEWTLTLRIYYIHLLLANPNRHLQRWLLTEVPEFNRVLAFTNIHIGADLASVTVCLIFVVFFGV